MKETGPMSSLTPIIQGYIQDQYAIEINRIGGDFESIILFSSESLEDQTKICFVDSHSYKAETLGDLMMVKWCQYRRQLQNSYVVDSDIEIEVG